MDIKNAVFVVGNTDVGKCPRDGFPEYAFIGRSNVGKSSLINMLTGQKGLALTSSIPGKTQLINYFLINNEWYLVDLPGYGYAQGGKQKRRTLQRIIDNYLCQRKKELTCIFVLIDCRHNPQKNDTEFIQQLGGNGFPFVIVFTKIDKLSNKSLKENIDVYQSTLLKNWEELPSIFVTSSERKIGRDEILNYIEDINKTLQL
ncbi:MAG: ribosome biogenesis GTP-binding protein YihA/YsxC [Candidatus Azobacteroides pseudotrichonymphae]|jgi:GTP-binding protein|nr:ribosome biogenesis GTP-binding protein YihA/YsxC [Bacteroidales bacterium OttesenSCG-928-I14]GMO33562.1 MAG: ribosome biogenesis GTP-binding protein YihA/YsxC [Candidatus Azobacteroides pseudotrichonymphae]